MFAVFVGKGGSKKDTPTFFKHHTARWVTPQDSVATVETKAGFVQPPLFLI